jgi:hypothetical protein
MKIQKSQAGFEPTAVEAKLSEANDLMLTLGLVNLNLTAMMKKFIV